MRRPFAGSATEMAHYRARDPLFPVGRVAGRRAPHAYPVTQAASTDHYIASIVVSKKSMIVVCRRRRRATIMFKFYVVSLDVEPEMFGNVFVIVAMLVEQVQQSRLLGTQA